jgi:hypothetical protein
MMPASLRGRLREQNNCGEERKHGNEFLFHHHTTGNEVALPIACTRRIAMNGGRVSEAQWDDKMTSVASGRVRNFCDQSVMMTRIRTR